MLWHSAGGIDQCMHTANVRMRASQDSNPVRSATGGHMRTAHLHEHTVLHIAAHAGLQILKSAWLAADSTHDVHDGLTLPFKSPTWPGYG